MFPSALGMPCLTALLLALAGTVLPPPAQAIPSYRYKVPNGARVPCPGGAIGEGCLPATASSPSLCAGLGHKTCSGGDFPLNPFGADWQAAGFQWTQPLCEKDSDGDGFSNGEELGDPCCSWTQTGATSHAANLLTDAEAALRISHPGSWGARPASPLRTANASCPAQGMPASSSSSAASFFLPTEAAATRKSVDFRISNFAVPDAETTYIDFAWDWQACKSSGACHLVGLEAIVDNKEMLHHFVLRGCTDAVSPAGMNGTVLQGGGSTKNAIFAAMNCGVDLGTWTPGKDPFFLAPPEAALPFKLRGLSVNVHYTNPLRKAGARDSSGFRVHYVTAARAHALGRLRPIALSSDPTLKIPAGQGRFFVTTSCRLDGISDPVGGGRGDGAVNLQFIWYHAHLLGREMYTELYHHGRHGAEAAGSAAATTPTATTTTNVDANVNVNRTVVWSERKWHFDDQYAVNLAGRTGGGLLALRNGDELQSTCVYDSRGRTGPTMMGYETDDEMCWNVLTYWPAQKDLRCADDGAGTTASSASSASSSGSAVSSSSSSSPSGMIWTGTLGPLEDGTGIRAQHPFTKYPDAQYPRADDLAGGKTSAFNRLSPLSPIRLRCLPEDLAAMPKGPVDAATWLGALCGYGGLLNSPCMKVIYASVTCLCPGSPGRDALDSSIKRTLLGMLELSFQTYLNQIFPREVLGCVKATREEMATLDMTLAAKMGAASPGARRWQQAQQRYWITAVVAAATATAVAFAVNWH